MRYLFISVILFTMFCLSGCSTSYERWDNMCESMHNIFLDGDGIN